MKAFAFVLLCALAAVQGRYTALDGTVSDQGENPWLVHMRIAVSTSGLLNTGVGSLISDRWVLTTAENVADARFIWLLFGVVDVINPTFVAETAVVRTNPNYNAATGENNIGLINSNRNVLSRADIAPISLAAVTPGPGRVCVYGAGGVLRCYNVNVAREDNVGLIIGGSSIQVTTHDTGTPLVNDDGQIGLLVGPGSGSKDSVGEFIATDIYLDWIQSETGIVLNPGPDPDVAAEAVHFVQ